MQSKMPLFLRFLAILIALIAVNGSSLLFSFETLAEQIVLHALPSDHVLKEGLEEIFAINSTPFESIDSLSECGFEVLHKQEKSKIVVVKHPQLEGYLIKGYLNSEMEPNTQNVYYQKLIDRCIGAENIRTLIRKKKIKNFTVPDKWLYTLQDGKNTVVLIVTDMQLVSSDESRMAWRERVGKEHLKELFLILSRGYASCWLAANIPYTKNGTFSCIDTEYPQRKLDLKKAKKYFSPKMQKQWKRITSTE